MPRRRATPPERPHATEIQVRQRVEEILRIRLDGAEFWDVREYAREKIEAEDPQWLSRGQPRMLSDGQLWRYVQASDILIADSAEPDRKKLLDRHLAQRRSLYARAVLAGDYRAGLAVLADEAKLLSLYPALKLDLKSSVEVEVAEIVVRTREEAKAALSAVAEASGLPRQPGIGEGVCGGAGSGQEQGGSV